MSVVENRKARHKYDILETLEVGIQLTGTEIKSIREGKASLAEAYLLVRQNELWLLNAYIAPYSHGNIQNHEPTRTRKCLARKSELKKLSAKVDEKGCTLVPLKLYFKKQWLKCQVAIAKGKKLHDKRLDSKEKSLKRQVDQAKKRRTF